MPKPHSDWRTEIATQVCKLVRNGRVMARFREMCAAFPEEKKLDEDRRREWLQKRKDHCLKGLRTLAKCKARRVKSERLASDSEALERTRPKKDTKKTWVFDYFDDHLSNDDLTDVEPGSTTLVRFAVWVPPELSLSAAPKLTVPPLFGRFTGHLHSPPFGTDIEPDTAGLPEKYATLAAFHDALFPERPPIDELYYIDCGRFTQELRRHERKHRRETVDALSDSFEASLRAWLTDVEDDLAAQNTMTAELPLVANEGSTRMEAKWLLRIAECVHEDTRNPLKLDHYRAMIRDWAREVVNDPRPHTMPAREYIKKKLPDWTDEQLEAHMRMHDFVDSAGVLRRGDEGDFILHDPISITTHAGTPLNKAYTTLAVIHDASEHCAFPLDPWASKNWPKVSESTPEDLAELHLGLKYELLKGCVVDLTAGDEPGLRRMLDEVAADLKNHVAPSVEKTAPSSALSCGHSEDFRSVQWFGTEHTFTKMQAAIVGQLWKARENGTPDVGGETLLETVDAQSSRLVDIFRNHSAWGTLIVNGRTKGSKRIANPPES